MLGKGGRAEGAGFQVTGFKLMASESLNHSSFKALATEDQPLTHNQ